MTPRQIASDTPLLERNLILILHNSHPLKGCRKVTGWLKLFVK